MSIYHSVSELVGRTPLLEVHNLENKLGLKAQILVKLEYLNPAGSVKDRIAKYIVEAAEKAGALKPGGTVIEATSGNTGIGLAAVGISKGYRVILFMPDTMSEERRKMIRAYGGEVRLTPGADGMKAAIAAASELQTATPNSILARQFENEANVTAHYETTGPEIWQDTEGRVDVLVSGVGTGGTITGVGHFLREQKPDVYIVAVEPVGSPVLSAGKSGKHKIQGIGAGFIPEVLDTEIYDEVITISDQAAFASAQAMSLHEGISIGISSGAALEAAMQLALRPEFEGKTIVTILPDGGDRYLSLMPQEIEPAAGSASTAI